MPDGREENGAAVDSAAVATPALGELLERAYARIDAAEFVVGDPVQFPRRYSRPEDIEVAGILCATLAWGRRASILSSCRRLLEPMGDSPYRYVMENGRNPSPQTGKAVHRTFSQSDLAFFLAGLRGVYRRYGSLEAVFAPRGEERGMWDGIARFREQMLASAGDYPLGRHISCPQRGSACKRLHLFLRWMVRCEGGIDLGLWERVRPSDLSMPLDVHVGRVSRSLGLLTRRQDDRRAVEELDRALRRYDPSDPVKYDLALFSLGESGTL